MKCFVGIIFVADTLNSFFDAAFLYRRLVFNFGMCFSSSLTYNRSFTRRRHGQDHGRRLDLRHRLVMLAPSLCLFTNVLLSSRPCADRSSSWFTVLNYRLTASAVHHRVHGPSLLRLADQAAHAEHRHHLRRIGVLQRSAL
jgi:hypothetical protein